MLTTKRLTAAVATAAIALGTAAAPAAFASSTHWTKAECKAYVKSFDKKHAPSSKVKADANKALKKYGCSERV